MSTQLHHLQRLNVKPIFLNKTFSSTLSVAYKECFPMFLNRIVENNIFWEDKTRLSVNQCPGGEREEGKHLASVTKKSKLFKEQVDYDQNVTDVFILGRIRFLTYIIAWILSICRYPRLHGCGACRRRMVLTHSRNGSGAFKLHTFSGQLVYLKNIKIPNSQKCP